MDDIEPRVGDRVMMDVEKAREYHTDYYQTDKETIFCDITDIPSEEIQDKYDFIGQSDDFDYFAFLWINEEAIIGIDDACPEHGTRKIYHDRREKMFCPFCEQ